MVINHLHTTILPRLAALHDYNWASGLYVGASRGFGGGIVQRGAVGCSAVQAGAAGGGGVVAVGLEGVVGCAVYECECDAS